MQEKLFIFKIFAKENLRLLENEIVKLKKNLQNFKYVALPKHTAQKMKSSLRIRSVSVTKSAGNCGFGHIY